MVSDVLTGKRFQRHAYSSKSSMYSTFRLFSILGITPAFVTPERNVLLVNIPVPSFHFCMSLLLGRSLLLTDGRSHWYSRQERKSNQPDIFKNRWLAFLRSARRMESPCARVMSLLSRSPGSNGFPILHRASAFLAMPSSWYFVHRMSPAEEAGSGTERRMVFLLRAFIEI